ncbi:MAG: hypothetical protein WC915_01500 [archaeon]|jgi:hypothetical protein
MKNIYLVLFILFCSSFAFAYESSLDTFGFKPIIINQPNKVDCIDLNITLPINETQKEHDPILSVYADFIGEIGDNSYVSVQINNSDEKILWPESFFCETDCVSRVFVPELRNNSAMAKICLRTGGKSTAKLTNAKIGLYNSPILLIENIAPSEIVLGQRAQIKIKVSNLGSKPSDVFVQFVAEDLRAFIDITSFDIVEGDASASTKINANEEKEFIFYIKPTQVSPYNLPSSVLFFENIFGEKQKVFSSHPQLNVTAPNQIDLVLIGGELKENVFNFKVRLKNNYATNFDGNLTIFPIDLVEQKTKIFLPAFAEKEIVFTTNELPIGMYSLIAQVDNNTAVYLSESISFGINNKNYIFEIFFAIIAIIVAISIFLAIHFEKI